MGGVKLNFMFRLFKFDFENFQNGLLFYFIDKDKDKLLKALL